MLREVSTHHHGSTKSTYKKTPKKKTAKTTTRTPVRTWQLLAKLFFLVLGVSIGVTGCYFWLYINYVEPNIPAPSIGRFRYILLHVRPEWYAWSAGVLITLVTSCIMLGRYFLYQKAYEYAWAKTQTRTRDKLATLTAQVEVSETLAKLCKEKLDTAYDELSYHRGWKANVLKATREPLNREEKRSNILLLK